MARTRVWATEEAGYTDSTAAASIDDKGTDLRVDVREVVNQLLGVAESTALADPVVAIPAGVALADLYPLADEQTYTLCIPWQSFHWAYEFLNGNSAILQQLFITGATSPVDSNLAEGADQGYVQVRDAASSSIAQTNNIRGTYGLVLPVGAVVTGLSAEFYRNNAAEQVTVGLLSHSATSAAGSTTIATATSTGSTTASMQSVAIASGLPATIAANIFYRVQLTITGAAANTQQRIYGVRLTYTSANANIRI